MNSRPAHSLRRFAAINSSRVALAAIATVAAVTLTPAASHADTSSTITVVGTSDVFDSDLIQNVIKPDFEAANPQYTLNYVSLGTGAAITYAKAGTASALLVHAASLENSFVASGPPSFSDEQFGRAIFYGVYVLLGPSGDPAGVMTGTHRSHNIVDAFEKIATAGAAGTADFVSRANTSGTSVEEHAIWALTNSADLCTISAGSNGGGSVPTTPGQPAACPAVPVNTIPAPAWYHETNLTQGPNIVAADACNFGHGNDCYTLTDRGTYQFLLSEGAISNLTVVGNHNASTAPGGANLLINSFHAYAINPAAFSASPNVHINLAGATAFLNWLTSPAGQNEITAYQTSDPGGPSFIKDAAPALTLTKKLPASVKAGGKLTVSGSLTNVVPGTPPIVGESMMLLATKAGSSSPHTVATTQTASNGTFTLSYKPTADASYRVATSNAPIVQIEIPASVSFGPQYGDLLQPTSKSIGKSTVTGAAAITKISAKKGVVTIKGTLSPAVSGSAARLEILAAHSSAKLLRLVSMKPLTNGAKTFTVTVKLARGHTWNVRVKYVNTGHIAAGASAARSVHVT
jgi:tungstate transport system substrate-binding protein